MAEVQDWSPIDDDNNSAPPVGAPEGMMPSAVNDIMRAMMGSLRRMYDKIVDGSLSLPYLPLAGGTVTGNVAINGTGGVSLSGVQLRNISGGLEVYVPGGGSVTSRGAVAGFVITDRDGVSAPWTWYATAGQSYLFNPVVGNVVGVNTAGRLTAVLSIDTQRYDILGTLFAQRSGNAHVIYDADGQVALSLYGAAGGQSNYYRADNHVWYNNSGGGVASLDSAGTFAAVQVSASGTVQAGSLVSNAGISATNATITGPVTATGFSTGGTMSANQGTFANLDASDIDCSGNIDAVSYTKSGVPVFAVTAAEFDALEARIANLETQLKERSYV